MEGHDIAFDSTVHATDDLGWDPDGEEPIDVPTDDGLLILVPPGEYAFPLDTGDEPACVRGDLTDWGIRGLGNDPRDVTFRTASGESGYFIRSGYNSEGILLENLAFDNTDARQGGDIGNFLQAQDAVEVHDVDHVGFSGREPYCRWSILPAIKSDDGEANVVNYTKTGPSVFAGHGASDGGGGVFDHEGHVTFRDCEIANQGGDGGLYTGKHNGSIVFEDCEFRNNDMAAIRTAAGSELRNCEIVIDWENAHPENVIDDATPPTGTMGIYFSSAQYGKSGGGIYDSTVRLLSTYDTAMAGILINPSDGAIDLHDTTVETHLDQRPVWFMDPREQRFDSHTTPAEPWGVDIRNLTVAGSGECHGQAAVILEGRHGSTIDGLTIDMPNAPAGLNVRASEDVELGTHDISVDGAAIRGDVRTDGGGNRDSDAPPKTLQFTNEGAQRAFYSFRAASTQPDEDVPSGQTNHHRDEGGAGGYLTPGETHTWRVAEQPHNCSLVGDVAVTVEGEPLEDVPPMDTPDWSNDELATAWGYPSEAPTEEDSTEEDIEALRERAEDHEARLDAVEEDVESMQEDRRSLRNRLAALFGR
ncbi:right-handed parallel beta-helix repeat-containing protein [Halomarina rubra]|uniref:Right handed beta helix domain-containing protein n=1 Tax=Halomarina rubra TaxID=2071873 RepID=A0ABD6AZ59_9EURY|nr:hypothetical protein [Halomarina rubra]